MIKSGFAKRYAQALLELAQAKGQTADFAGRLVELLQLFQDNSELNRLVYGKMMTAAAKKQLLLQLLGEDAPVELRNFICLVVDKSRENNLADILAAYRDLQDLAEGVRQVQVYTAVPLAAKEQAALEEALAQRLHAKIRLKTAVDKNLIGGLKVQIDDTVYDASLSQQLHALQESLSTEYA